jgi:hypothetical protein
MRRLAVPVRGMAWLGARAHVAHGRAPRPPVTERAIVAGRVFRSRSPAGGAGRVRGYESRSIRR